MTKGKKTPNKASCNKTALTKKTIKTRQPSPEKQDRRSCSPNAVGLGDGLVDSRIEDNRKAIAD